MPSVVYGSHEQLAVVQFGAKGMIFGRNRSVVAWAACKTADLIEIVSESSIRNTPSADRDMVETVLSVAVPFGD